jgi:hypothetical protein
MKVTITHSPAKAIEFSGEQIDAPAMLDIEFHWEPRLDFLLGLEVPVSLSFPPPAGHLAMRLAAG